jgi:hypothetical protein
VNGKGGLKQLRHLMRESESTMTDERSVSERERQVNQILADYLEAQLSVASDRMGTKKPISGQARRQSTSPSLARDSKRTGKQGRS